MKRERRWAAIGNALSMKGCRPMVYETDSVGRFAMTCLGLIRALQAVVSAHDIVVGRETFI